MQVKKDQTRASGRPNNPPNRVHNNFLFGQVAAPQREKLGPRGDETFFAGPDCALMRALTAAMKNDFTGL